MADILAQLAKHGVVPTAMSRELTEYALSKPGVQPDSSAEYDSHEVLLALPRLEVPGPTWSEFYEVDYDDGPWATLYVRPDALKTHRQQFPNIRRTDYSPREGHVTMLVPQDGHIPMEVLRQFVDDAYDIVFAKLSEVDRLFLQFGQEPLGEEQLLDRLIEHYETQQHSAAIHGLARPALQLVTNKVADSKIGIGASKLGGRPDLPSGSDWPRFDDGQPLAFLGQLNLADVSKVGSPLPKLPKSGLLTIFSAWGWVNDEDSDPQVPRQTMSDGSQPGWTLITHFPKRLQLQRRTAPRGVHRFNACSVNFRPVLSLPTDDQEPSVRELQWNGEKTETLMDLAIRFGELRNSARFRSEREVATRHQLGGYARFQQEYCPEVDSLDLAMLLQIGCDPRAQMSWGDDGELIFYCDRAGLQRGRIQNVWGACQSA